MSKETVDNEVTNETEAPKAVSELKAQPAKAEAKDTKVAATDNKLGVIVYGNLDDTTYSNTNYFYPFLRQVYDVRTINPQATGYGSQNLGGFVYQNGQYNSKREGGNN